MSKNTINTTLVADALRERVKKSIKDLEDIGITKSPKYYFSLKYPEYNDLADPNYLNNLWYGRSTSEDFTRKLEAFVIFKSVQYGQ